MLDETRKEDLAALYSAQRCSSRSVRHRPRSRSRSRSALPPSPGERAPCGSSRGCGARRPSAPAHPAAQPTKRRRGPEVTAEPVRELPRRTARLVLSVLLGCLDNSRNDKSPSARLIFFLSSLKR